MKTNVERAEEIGILEDLRENHTDEQINNMDAYDILDAYLQWNGIIGWTGVIRQIVRRFGI